MPGRSSVRFPVTVAAFLVASGALRGQVPCFKTEPTLPWEGEDIGTVRGGASRPIPGGVGYELCSISAGFEKASESLRYLFQPTRADFEMVAHLSDLSGGGLGGVMARLDFRMEGSPYIAIYLRFTAAGGPQIVSTYRPADGEAASNGGAQPVQFGLPCFLRVRREGSVLTTAYSSDGQTFTDHLQVKAEGTSLDYLFLYAGMVQASENLQAPSSAFFSDARLRSQETEIPPRLDQVSPFNCSLAGGIPVKITGAFLGEAQSVSLAGIPARIESRSPGELVVLAGRAPGPLSGDVIVVTRTGEERLEKGFAYVGSPFIRGDFFDDGTLDITDIVRELSFMFLGGPGPLCKEAADTNGDNRVDIADPITTIQFLYVGGKPPPSPFPLPGVTDTPCGSLEAPRLLKLSTDTIRQGDLVTLEGTGFSEDPGATKVYFGDSPAEVLEATKEKLVVRVDAIINPGSASPRIISDYSSIPIGPILLDCKTKACGLTLVGISTLYNDIIVKTIGSRLAPLAAAHPRDAKTGQIVLDFDRQQWDPYQTYDVDARLLLPAVYELSRGSLMASFEYRQYTPETRFEDWLQGLADRLQEMLSGGGVAREALVRTDLQNARILLDLDQSLVARLSPAWLDSLIAVGLRPPPGKCGPSNLDPVADRRAFGWCRFEELISSCNGYPSWQYFIPKSKVFQVSGSIFPLVNPNHMSTGDLSVLFNRSAYCHVRDKGLYKDCVLDQMEALHYSQVPHFPRSAIVIKTRWSTAATLTGAGKDPSKHYSYTYTGDGQTYYLELFHFTTKDVDNWFWADFYVPPSAGTGGCGGSGADRPGSITGVWANYQMCTNLEESEGPTACGNNMIGIECEQNCVSCHNGATHGTLKQDFLFSLQAAISGPPACP